MAAKPSKAEAADKKLDKSLGIKEGSARDMKADKKAGVYDEEYGTKKKKK